MIDEETILYLVLGITGGSILLGVMGIFLFYVTIGAMASVVGSSMQNKK